MNLLTKGTFQFIEATAQTIAGSPYFLETRVVGPTSM